MVALPGCYMLTHRFFSTHALSSLKQSHGLYAQLEIFTYKYLVTAGDRVELPYLLKDTQVGDTIRFNKLTQLGSRDHTIEGSPYIDQSLFTCEARVLEKTKQPMKFMEKTKKRQRRVKTVKSKPDVTVLRITKLELT